MRAIELQSERLVLRSPQLDDAAPLLALYTDPEAMAFIGGVNREAEIDPTFIVRRWLDRWKADGVGQLVAVRRNDGAVLGRVGLVVWDTRDWRITTIREAGDHAQPELGWAFARAHWGRGYATEAALAVRAWAREVAGIERLISVIAPDNRRSQRVAEKLGCTAGETVILADTGPAVVWTHPPGHARAS